MLDSLKENTFADMPRERESVRETVAGWKSALLDLSAANSLVSLPETGLVDMSAPNEIFDALVRRKKPLHFWDIGNKNVDRTVLRDAGNYPARATAMASFRDLHHQAVALLTGQDINVLFVAFGLLHWVDPETGVVTRSPLLLVPVSVEPHATGTGYTVAAMEEPVEVNPVVKLRLAQSDIDFTLPPSPDERYLIPSSYLGAIAAATAERDRWMVEERTVLGRFPLLKLRLYEDLTAQEERALSHPLIAALAGQPEALTELPAVGVPSLADLERDDASESQYLLLDADPAQERAIVSAARGQSFVLQGPPGTGKTQTIANIIGECAAAGKSVLLVSGRMASLDAVHQRLSDKSLGDLCLLAHSLKTSKRDILAQLEQTLVSPGKATGGAAVRSARQKERDEMKTVRTRLNAFTETLHTRVEPLGLSVYDALGCLVEAGETGETDAQMPPVSFGVRDIRDVSPDDLAEMEEKVATLSGSDAFRDTDAAPIWIGAFRDTGLADLSGGVEKVLRLLEGQTRRIQHAAQTIAPLCGLDAPVGLADTALYDALAEGIVTSSQPVLPHWLAAGTDPETLRSTAYDLSVRYAAYKEERDQFLRRWEEEILDENHPALFDRLEGRHVQTLAPLLGDEWRDRVTSEYSDIFGALDAVGQDGRVLTERLGYLADKSGLSLDGSLDARQKLLKITRQAIDLPNPCVGWFAPGATGRLVTQLKEAQLQWERYSRGTEQLFTFYSEDILDLPHGELLAALETQKGGFGRLISAFNNRVSLVIRGVTRPGAITKDRDMEEDLTLAAEMKELRRWCASRTEALLSSFGSHYLGARTDWDGVQMQLEKSANLALEFDNGRVPAPLIALMLLGDSDLKQFEAVFLQINALLAHLREAWEKLSAVAVSPDALPDPTVRLIELTEWCDNTRNAVTDFYEAYRLAMQNRRGDDKDPAAVPLPVYELVSELGEAGRLAQERTAFRTEYAALGESLGADLSEKDANLSAIFDGLSTAAFLRELFGQEPIPAAVAEKVREPLVAEEKAKLLAAREQLQIELGLLDPALTDLATLFHADYLRVTQADGSIPLIEAPFDTQLHWIQTRLDHIPSLGSGLGRQILRDECAAVRLEGFFDAVADRATDLSPETLVSLFRRGFYSAWAQEIMRDVPGILPFSGASHEAQIDRFRDLDRRQMDAVPGLIRELVRVRSPKNYPDEVKTLKGQLARRRTGEVRKLLAEIPSLLFALKPIVMMNPLSVRLFLDADALRFDVVLFDDASQITTEDAIGAILRGQQVIIAGDPQQIPPLALLVESDKPFESILDAANAVASKSSPHFGSHTLRWHYRSRNESLIAFSRRYFYPELVSFPSATVDSAIDYIDAPPTMNEAGDGSEDAGIAKVVDAVLAYSAEYPDHSIGVIALDDTAFDRIGEEIVRRKEADPELILPGDHDENNESFFLKTLENVQGDERDMVILYVGADPTQCQPLSAFGGERLLNVAITRARARMIIVSAFSYNAPPARDTVEHRGMLLLRSFLRYAKEGVGKVEVGADGDPAASLLLPGTHIPDVPAPSAIEAVVESRLREKGYQIRKQVGLSEYRVDLAVVNPDKPQNYLLGIEFDGPMYSTGETARHRDRLRVDMLLDRGWNLHRVWALDFEADPDREIGRIEAAIARAKKAGATPVGGKRRTATKRDMVAEA